MKKTVSIGLSMALLASASIPAFASDFDHDSKSEKHKQIESIEFSSMKAPSTIESMVKTYTDATVKITYKDGSVKETPLDYKQLFLSKDKIVKNKGEMIPAGTPIDAKGNPIVDKSIPDKPSYFVSDAPDSNSFITIAGKSYIISHYEYDSIDNAGKSISGLPASMTLTQVDQNKETGELTVNNSKKIDFSNVNGLWTPCNGTTTEWNTHLGSEEYEPDARSFEDPSSSSYKAVTNFANYYFGDKSKANPYFYGWIPEISVNAHGEPSVVKHYSTGRFSHELMQVLPDNQTAIFGDDGGNTMIFMYVVDKKKDFSAGTLYAAKFKQTSTENGGAGNLEWIKLGHSTDKEVKSIIDKGTKFSDIFDTATQPTAGYTAIKTSANKNVEYLKVKPGMEKAAAFLESRRYGAILGATAEFNKMEGIAVNKKDKKAYVAMSYQSGSMQKQEGSVQDDIQLPVINSGVTYQIDLGRGQKDKSGRYIESGFVPTSMKGLIVGEDLKTPDAYGNTAAPDKVANPDNLTFSNDLNTLFIGEDSSMHTNNFVWAYNVKTKKLSRILSVTVGAEATGLRAVDDANDFRYILSNYQHPGEDLEGKQITAVDKAKLEEAMKQGIGIQETGGVGYISGLPSGDIKSKYNRFDK
ncbi:PhoX family protein [Ectobacillus panaciterrae]|uniref:PhoX family protein n=1 Tax=Ectobacillus panaciterrae TaxID=363872 RepID=UPI0004139537|nr:alkaline phosphatase PhoX [Ectobacillus panaciterrae]